MEQPNLLEPKKICECGTSLYSDEDIFLIIDRNTFKPMFVCKACYNKYKKLLK